LLTAPVEQLDAARTRALTCRSCPRVRKETPFAISCLELDGSISCARERIGRHQSRLLDPNWTCPIEKKEP